MVLVQIEEPSLDWEALTVALDFLEEKEENGSIVLQVPNKEHLPYVRRRLQKEMGVASKTIGDSMYYGTKMVMLTYLMEGESKTGQDLFGASITSPSSVFFIDDLDEPTFSRNSTRLFTLPYYVGMMESDLYNLSRDHFGSLYVATSLRIVDAMCFEQVSIYRGEWGRLS